MKKRNVVALLVSIVMIFSMFLTSGCVSYEEDLSNGRLTVKVFNYNGGVGSAWVENAIKRFEEANKDREFSNGKKGVYVELTKEKNYPMEVLATKEESVFFVEGVDFNNYATQGLFMEINDVVKNDNPYETGKSIESKLSADTKNALTGLNGNYYVVPHYQSYDGVQYNKDVFDEYNFYFAAKEDDYVSKKEGDPGYGFIKNADCEKTVGPNGKKGDYDDGLPSSVEEFERLCDYIKSRSVIPFIFFDGFNKAYQQKLTNALWASLEGYDGTMAQYRFNTNGAKTTIITGWNGDTPVTEEVVITKDNAHLMYKQESRYYALKFCEYLFSSLDNYTGLSNTGDHIKAQQYFMGGREVAGKTDTFAMLIEGTYWRNEAADNNVFKDYPTYQNIETRFMPLPVKGTGTVTNEEEGKNPVVIDTLSSYAFINKNIVAKNGDDVNDVKTMAKEFLQFCYTDESLREFTVSSSVTKDVVYSLEDSDYDKLSSYAKSVWDMKENGKVVNPISGEKEFIDNPGYFSMNSGGAIWETNAGGKHPCQVFYYNNDTKTTARQYFEGISQLKTENWWNGIKNAK